MVTGPEYATEEAAHGVRAEIGDDYVKEGDSTRLPRADKNGNSSGFNPQIMSGKTYQETVYDEEGNPSRVTTIKMGEGDEEGKAPATGHKVDNATTDIFEPVLGCLEKLDERPKEEAIAFIHIPGMQLRAKYLDIAIDGEDSICLVSYLDSPNETPVFEVNKEDEFIKISFPDSPVYHCSFLGQSYDILRAGVRISILIIENIELTDV